MKGVLFSSPMVRAVIRNTNPKCMTRRPVPPKNIIDADESGFAIRGEAPYGEAGSIVYVKETYFAWGYWSKRYSEKKGRDEWHFIDLSPSHKEKYRYAATDNPDDLPRFQTKRIADSVGYWKRPAIFMPEAAARIKLEITGVRVERLNEISEEDAIAEGVEADDQLYCGFKQWKNYTRERPLLGTAKMSFETLWASINGYESLKQNPLVYVYSFKRIHQ